GGILLLIDLQLADGNAVQYAFTGAYLHIFSSFLRRLLLPGQGPAALLQRSPRRSPRGLRGNPDKRLAHLACRRQTAAAAPACIPQGGAALMHPASGLSGQMVQRVGTFPIRPGDGSQRFSVMNFWMDSAAASSSSPSTLMVTV